MLRHLVPTLLPMAKLGLVCYVVTTSDVSLCPILVIFGLKLDFSPNATSPVNIHSPSPYGAGLKYMYGLPTLALCPTAVFSYGPMSM